MATYSNITSATTTTLYAKPTEAGEGLLIPKALYISNNHTADCSITLYIDDGTVQYYIVTRLIIPTGTAVEIHNISFDEEICDLKLTTNSSTTDITVKYIYD